MPTSTFFNLPREKREKVINAAIDEFASNTYHKASVTRIINKADIASGSFYQYFDDKKDLYKYIIELLGETKMTYMKPLMEKLDKMDFFQFLREVYLSAIRFARENPKMDSIGNMLINSKDSIYEEIIGNQSSKSVQFMEEMLKAGIKKGDIDPEIDPHLMARLYTKINLEMADIIYDDGKADLDDMVVIDKLLYVIENGIRLKKES